MQNNRNWTKKNKTKKGKFVPDKAFKDKQTILNAMKVHAKELKKPHNKALEDIMFDQGLRYTIMKGFITSTSIIVMDYHVSIGGIKLAILIDRSDIDDEFIRNEGYFVIHTTKQECFDFNFNKELLKLGSI